MGVIHKLKPEVIEFIIQTKKDEPSTGVRKLAEIASQKFGIKISKSSISTILKDSQLSSTVGRKTSKPKIKAEKKFEIPKNKKVQIIQDLEKLKPATEELSLPLLPDSTQAKSLNEINEPLIKDLPKTNKKTYKAAGLILFKMILWEVIPPKFFTDIFKKYIKGSLPDSFEKQCHILLSMYVLDIKSLSDLDNLQNYAFWIYDDLQSLDQKEDLFGWTENLQYTPTLSAEFSLKLKQLQIMIKEIRVNLSSGKTILIDPRFSKVWKEGDSKLPLVPLDKALGNLSAMLISNKDPLIFLRRDNVNSFNELWKIIEGDSENSVDSISLFGPQDEEMASFSVFPDKKRVLMFGIFPEEKEFSKITKAVQWIRRQEFDGFGADRKMFYCSTTTNVFSGVVGQDDINHHVVTVWVDGQEDPSLAIVCNQASLKGKDILSAFMKRWPFCRNNEQFESEGYDLYNKGKTLSEQEDFNKVTGFVDIVETISNQINNDYIRPLLADIYNNNSVKQYISDIYGVSGFLNVLEDKILVNLDEFPKKIVENGENNKLKLINYLQIMDPVGRQPLIVNY